MRRVGGWHWRSIMDREDLQPAPERCDAARAELAAFPYDSLTVTSTPIRLESQRLRPTRT